MRKHNTTTRADRTWPWRNTIVHSALSLGRFPLSLGNRPVVFLVATLRWPPVRCAAGLVFLWSAVPREDRPQCRWEDLCAATGGELKWTSVVTRGLGAPDTGTSSRHPLSKGCPLLAVSGSSWGPAEVSVVCSLDCGWSLAIAGVQSTGAVCHLHRPAPSATPPHNP